MSEQNNPKAVVILSGGMDSTTLLYHVLDKGYDVSVLSFDYGQRHKRELLAAQQTCEKLGVEQKLVNLTSVMQVMKGSALTDDIEVPEGHYSEESMKQTVVPNRNMIMLSVAIAEAVSIGAGEVFYGAHAGDHAIYPDCRREFIEKVNEVAQIANYEPVSMVTPYIDMDKGDILEDGKRLGVDYSLTWTCYKGKGQACGKCGSCVERLEGFEKAGMTDPVEYEQ